MTDATHIPGGRQSGPQVRGFAASLRTSASPNNDVYIKVPKSPRLHRSRAIGGQEKGISRKRSGQKRNKGSRLIDSKVDVASSTELVRYDPVPAPEPNDDWYHATNTSSGAAAGGSSRAALLARRRKLRGVVAEPPAPIPAPAPAMIPAPAPATYIELDSMAMPYNHPHNHRGVQSSRQQQPALTVDALAQASSRHSSYNNNNNNNNSSSTHSRYAGSSVPGSPRRTSSSAVAFNTTIPRTDDRRPPSSVAADVSSFSTTSAAKEQTRIFRMSGLTPRELIIENLRLQDHMTELQDRQHESLVANMRLHNGVDGGSGIGGERRAERSVNVLATTNADLSRRVQSAVVGEANAMARLQRMEQETKQQEKRFSELVEISRGEEASREEAENVAKECQEKLKVAEDRVVRLLSRLHAETQNTTRLKKLLVEANNRMSEMGAGTQAGDDALARAYENVQAECLELRNQVSDLRDKNSRMVNDLRKQAMEDQ